MEKDYDEEHLSWVRSLDMPGILASCRFPLLRLAAMCTCDRLGAARVICSKYPNLALLVPWQNEQKPWFLTVTHMGPSPLCFFPAFWCTHFQQFQENTLQKSLGNLPSGLTIVTTSITQKRRFFEMIPLGCSEFPLIVLSEGLSSSTTIRMYKACH